MAGVGLLLRRLNPYRSFLGVARVYGTAALISSGPWLISILGILLIGFVALHRIEDPNDVAAFQASVTYLFAGSLILTGPLQFLFTRFVADRLYEDRREAVTPGVIGALLLTTVVAAAVGTLLTSLLFDGTSFGYRALMVIGLVTMSDIWIVVILLTGLKAYRLIVASFVVAYGVVLAGTRLGIAYGLEGFLAAFLVGKGLLLFVLLSVVVREYPSPRFIAFDFLKRHLVFPGLALTGLLYNSAIWVDKIAFWFHPETGVPLVGPLRTSIVYDIPIFLAYLTIVPGMAVFLVRVETDFAQHYDRFYDMVRNGAPLPEIERGRDRMIESVRTGFYDILKVQGVTLALVFSFAPEILDRLSISRNYLGLFYLDSIGVAAQLLFLSILNVAFYIDQRRVALILCLLFTVFNLASTLVTQSLGPAFYGYGFTLSAILVVLIGLALLSRRLEHLVRETFMLQGAAS